MKPLINNKCPDCGSPSEGDSVCGPIRCPSCHKKLVALVSKSCSEKGKKEKDPPPNWKKAPLSGEKRQTPKIPAKFLVGPATHQPDGLTVRQREKIH